MNQSDPQSFIDSLSSKFTNIVNEFDTLKIEDVSPNRVYVSGCRGSSPPDKHKVCINLAGGFRNGMEIILTGLDIEEKAEVFINTLFNSVGGKDQFDKVDIHLHKTHKDNPTSNEEAMASLVIDVKSKNPDLVGRLFSAKIIELALANIPGFFAQGGVKSNGPVIVYWPALVNSKYIKEIVNIDNKKIEVAPTSQLDFEEIYLGLSFGDLGLTLASGQDGAPDYTEFSYAFGPVSVAYGEYDDYGDNTTVSYGFSCGSFDCGITAYDFSDGGYGADEDGIFFSISASL